MKTEHQGSIEKCVTILGGESFAKRMINCDMGEEGSKPKNDITFSKILFQKVVCLIDLLM